MIECLQQTEQVGIGGTDLIDSSAAGGAAVEMRFSGDGLMRREFADRKSVV